MNKKGFTLVEVIVVIVIIALLVLILVPNVFALVEKNNTKSCNSLKDNIESAAKMYVTNNKYNLGFTCGGTKNITLQTLIDSGDLTPDSSGKIINPVKKTEIPLTNVVKVTYDCNSGTFSYVIEGIYCNKDEEENASNNDNNDDNNVTEDNNDSADNNASNDSNEDNNTNENDDSFNITGGSTEKKIIVTDNSNSDCATYIEYYYEDNYYKYYFMCLKSSSVIVTVNEVPYTIKEALNSGIVTMEELEEAGFVPLKEPKDLY